MLNSRQAMTCWFHRLFYRSIALDPKARALNGDCYPNDDQGA
jgi:hypothetical protein